LSGSAALAGAEARSVTRFIGVHGASLPGRVAARCH
jgi:hypothetical protein